ncbi:MAG: QueG-associated DUF1730 domain-containing protein [Alphaproteobacteria bacterium]
MKEAAPRPEPKARIRERALALGFDAVGFARPAAAATAGQALRRFVAAGQHGDMGWLADTLERRADPNTLWPGARSIVVLGKNYGPATDPLAGKAPWPIAPTTYALGHDYHVVKKALRSGPLDERGPWLRGQAGRRYGACRRPPPPPALAGQHTNLVSRDFGSWLFLGEIFTDLDLEPDPPGKDRCGQRGATAASASALPRPFHGALPARMPGAASRT